MSYDKLRMFDGFLKEAERRRYFLMKEDKVFIRNIIADASLATARMWLMDYLNDWDKGSKKERNVVKKENVGRRLANSNLRERHKEHMKKLKQD